MSERHSHEPHAVRELSDGVEDKLVPLVALDPLKIGSFDELVTAMGRTAFGGRALGEACDVLTAMAEDPECLIVATFSGAMTVAKMGIVIVRMIEAGLIHAVISTGALMDYLIWEEVGVWK